jgi:hypothetical protein
MLIRSVGASILMDVHWMVDRVAITTTKRRALSVTESIHVPALALSDILELLLD